MREVIEKLQNAIKTAEAEAATLWGTFDAARKEASAEGVDFTKDKDAFGKLDEAGKAYDAKRDQVSELRDQLSRAIAMGEYDGGKGAQPGGGVATLERPRTRKSLGDSLAENSEYLAMRKAGKFENRDVAIGTTEAIKLCDAAELKTLLTSDGTTGGGTFLLPDMQPGYVELARRPFVVTDLITVGTTEVEVVEFVKINSRTNAAAETAEAGATGDGSGAAPESAVGFTVVQTNVRDLTHFLPATKRILNDVGLLRTLIDQELSDGLKERLDAQLIVGDGTGQNLKGILNTSGILSQALGSDTRSDAVHKAITQIRLAFYEPEVVLLHPTDYQSIVLEKDARGDYIYGPPSQPQRGTIWGLQAVPNPVITQGTALVGNYRRGATLWLREGITIAASDSHSDFFTRRMVAVLGTMRAAFGVPRPKCFAQVTGL